jgi:UDP:flavonoid glycosyltransferase YjiC (YdhE family)
VPYFADQPFWARRIYQLGVSPKPIPRDKLSAQKLAAAILEAIQEKNIRESALQLGKHIRKEDGVTEAVQKIDHYLSEPEKLIQFNP